jgi:transketolase
MNKGFEQLRVTVAYPKLNVKVVGTHSGISIGEDGPSQMSVEETGLACSLPGFVVLSPADEVSATALVLRDQYVGPVFIRTGRRRRRLYPPDQKFEIGKAIQLTEARM